MHRGSLASRVAGVFLVLLVLICTVTLGYTTSAGKAETGLAAPRYAEGSPAAGRLPPWWVTPTEDQARRLDALVGEERVREIAARLSIEESAAREDPRGIAAIREHWPRYWLGTDALGRSLGVRMLVGGAVSLGVGMLAAVVAVAIGTLYGTVAAYAGGRVDAVMMRVVDVLYGLPTILMVVLLAVAADSLVDGWVNRTRERAAFVEASGASGIEIQKRASELYPPRELSSMTRTAIDLGVLLAAIGGVSWLTMARVVRGQVLSLKSRPFVEAARAIGASPARIFLRHLLPNLVGTIAVYGTLAVPQAVLSESFLSFLGVGVRPPLPSWGVLCADGLPELNPYRSNWWLLAFPCAALGATLLSLNFVGEGLRERMDPMRSMAR
jgi:oligopeptide transport system permease protein